MGKCNDNETDNDTMIDVEGEQIYQKLHTSCKQKSPENEGERSYDLKFKYKEKVVCGCRYQILIDSDGPKKRTFSLTSYDCFAISVIERKTSQERYKIRPFKSDVDILLEPEEFWTHFKDWKFRRVEDPISSDGLTYDIATTLLANHQSESLNGEYFSDSDIDVENGPHKDRRSKREPLKIEAGTYFKIEWKQDPGHRDHDGVYKQDPGHYDVTFSKNGVNTPVTAHVPPDHFDKQFTGRGKRVRRRESRKHRRRVLHDLLDEIQNAKLSARKGRRG